jgi:mannose-6-phosphate isomerase class I
LVSCDKFIVDRWSLDRPRAVGGDNRCHLLVLVHGTLTLERDAWPEPLVRGQTALLPAAAGTVQLTPAGNVTLLDIYLPGP